MHPATAPSQLRITTPPVLVAASFLRIRENLGQSGPGPFVARNGLALRWQHGLSHRDRPAYRRSLLLGRRGVETVRVVCAHDCPDMCSLLAHVENGRVVRVEGDPDQPFTAGFACAKVNRDAELVHSPERLATPLRRVGAKGEGKFAPITWDEALDEITVALEVHHRRVGPAGAARLRLQRASGPDEPRPAERPVPCDGHQPAVGRHGVRQLQRGGVGRDGRADRRRRSGIRGRSPTW